MIALRLTIAFYKFLLRFECVRVCVCMFVCVCVCVWGVGKSKLCLKLVRITLQTWNSVRTYTRTVTVFLLSILVTSPSLMPISLIVLELGLFVNKRLIRNPKIGISSVWVLSNIWRQGQVRDRKIGTNISNDKLRNGSKRQDYSFYLFWVIKGEPTGLEGIITRLGLIHDSMKSLFLGVGLLFICF